MVEHLEAGLKTSTPQGPFHELHGPFSGGAASAASGAPPQVRQAGSIITAQNPGDQYGDHVGDTVNLQIKATDSTPGQTLTFSATDLPPGVSISNTGLISGAIKAAGAFVPTITATDTTGAAGSVFFHWPVPGVITITNPGNQATAVGGTVWVPISATSTAVGTPGSGARLFYSETGLPPSLDFDPSTGLISGWPEAAGTYHVSVTAKDGASPCSVGVLHLDGEPGRRHRRDRAHPAQPGREMPGRHRQRYCQRHQGPDLDV